MNLFIFKLFLIYCLLKPNQGNITESINNNDILPATIKKEIDEDFMYYLTGARRDPDKLKIIKYVVSIRTRNPQKYFGDNHFCAGIIISKNIVLTSAHCVMDKRRVLYPSRRLLLVAGTPNRLQPLHTTIQYPVKSISANTDFIRKNQHDIAIVRLKHNIPDDNENIKIAKMPSGPPVANATCTAIGWGRILAKGPLAGNPIHTDFRLFDPKECESALGKYYYKGILCATSDIMNKSGGTCRGDTGGPLICNEELTGIISWTIGCGNNQYPSLFTDVWYNSNWLDKHLSAAICLDINMNIFVIVAVIIFITK